MRPERRRAPLSFRQFVEIDAAKAIKIAQNGYNAHELRVPTLLPKLSL
jgi:hypothetical protein